MKYIKPIISAVVAKYDSIVFFMFWRTVNRLCKEKPGMAYLMYNHLQHGLIQNPIPDSLRRATELFYETIKK